MLDDLLGRTKLKERISELETECNRLESQLEAEQERRADAKTARQAAEERLNRLKDKIADLEGQLQQANSSSEEVGFRSKRTINGQQRNQIVHRLEAIEWEPESICSASIQTNIPDDVIELVPNRIQLIQRILPCIVYVDEAGFLALAMKVPMQPPQFCSWNSSPQIKREWIAPPENYSIGLVRSDTFAFGILKNEELVDFEGIKSPVKSQHSKGGYSQRRFERLREEQIDTHLDKCKSVLNEAPEPRIVVGDRQIIRRLSDIATVTKASDVTGHTKDALSDAVWDFWSFTVYGL